MICLTVELIRPEIREAWEDNFRNCNFVGGPDVQDLETNLARKLEAKAAVAMANGTDALLIALQAMGIGAGMKVALPNLTFWATYEAVAQLGAEPVLIDINPMDQHLDYGELCSTHQKVKLDAIIFVHLFGYTSSDLQKIRDFASTEGIPLLEDAAQAFGVQHKGRSVFADAELSTISFYPAKVFGGISDGGAILGRNPELIEKCRKLKESRSR